MLWESDVADNQFRRTFWLEPTSCLHLMLLWRYSVPRAHALSCAQLYALSQEGWLDNVFPDNKKVIGTSISLPEDADFLLMIIRAVPAFCIVLVDTSVFYMLAAVTFGMMRGLILLNLGVVGNFSEVQNVFLQWVSPYQHLCNSSSKFQERSLPDIQADFIKQTSGTWTQLSLLLSSRCVLEAGANSSLAVIRAIDAEELCVLRCPIQWWRKCISREGQRNIRDHLSQQRKLLSIDSFSHADDSQSHSGACRKKSKPLKSKGNKYE